MPSELCHQHRLSSQRRPLLSVVYAAAIAAHVKIASRIVSYALQTALFFLLEMFVSAHATDGSRRRYIFVLSVCLCVHTCMYMRALVEEFSDQLAVDF